MTIKEEIIEIFEASTAEEQKEILAYCAQIVAERETQQNENA